MVPKPVKDALGRYVVAGVETGGFLRAVLENNLTQSVFRADIENQRELVNIVKFIYNYLPAFSHGDHPAIVEEWLTNGWKKFKWEGSDFALEYKDDLPELLSIRREKLRRIAVINLGGK